MPHITLPIRLARLIGSVNPLPVEGKTVGEAMGDLVNTYPSLKPYLFDEQNAFCSFVCVYLNDQDVRYLAAEKTPLQENDMITLVSAVAGG